MVPWLNAPAFTLPLPFLSSNFLLFLTSLRMCFIAYFDHKMLKHNGFPCQGKGHTGLDEFVATLQSSKFSWSPPGHGWSNHREWEILISGSVPVVEFHPNMLEVYRGLPVVQVMHRWEREKIVGRKGEKNLE